MSHQVFERKWRCRVFPAARLSERPLYAAVSFRSARLGRRALCASPEVGVAWRVDSGWAFSPSRSRDSAIRSDERGPNVGRASWAEEKALKLMFVDLSSGEITRRI